MEWWPRRCRLTVALLLILLAVAHRDVLAEPAVPPGTGGVVGGVHTDPHRIGGAGGASGDDVVVTQASAHAGKTHEKDSLAHPILLSTSCLIVHGESCIRVYGCCM
jgi:hypothetical protein